MLTFRWLCQAAPENTGQSHKPFFQRSSHGPELPGARRGLAGEAASHPRAHCTGRETPALGLLVFQTRSRQAEPSPGSRDRAAVPVGSLTLCCSSTHGESRGAGLQLQLRPGRAGGRAPAPADNVSSGGYLEKPANPSNTRCFLQKSFYIHIKTSRGDFLILMNFLMKQSKIKTDPF